MAQYPMPPWLSPSAAQGYGALAGEASRAALSAQLQRERMSQEATQAAIEGQQRSQETAAANAARQEQLNQEHQMEQQKIAIEQQYKQQQIGLQTADLDLAQKTNQRTQEEWNAKVEQAAKSAASHARFTKAITPKEQGGEGMEPIKAALLYNSSTMSATELGRLSALDKPPPTVRPSQDVPGLPGYKAFDTGKGVFELRPTIPDVMTNAPPAIPVTDENGDVIAHYSINPATHKPELIRPPPEGAGSGTVNKLVENEKKKRGLDTGKPAGKVSTAVDTYKTADDVRAAFRTKKITAEEAKKILKDKFGFE